MKTAIFSCLLLFAGIACAAAEPLNVYCTTFPLYLLTRNLTQGCRNVHTELIIPPGTGCPHDYALTPRDMRKLGAKNMVLVRNGLGLDDFILKPLRKMNPGAKIIDTSAGIPALELEEKCGHDDCHEHHHGSKNPHLFASPFEAVRIVEKPLIRRMRRHTGRMQEFIRRSSASFAASLPLPRGNTVSASGRL